MAKKKKEQEKNIENKSNEEIFENEFLSQPQLVWRILKRHRLGLTAMFILIVLYLLAIFADFFSPMDPYNNHIKYRYMQPMDTYTTDQITGEKVDRHVYLYTLTRDPITRKGSFVEATHFDKFRAYDPFEDVTATLELGKYNETYGATVTNIQYSFKEIIRAKTSDGELIDLTTSTDPLKSLIPLTYFKSENVSGNLEKIDGMYDADLLKMMRGSEVLVNTDTRDYAIEEYKNHWQYGSKIADKEIEEIVTYKQLNFVEVQFSDFTVFPLEIYPEDIEAVSFKRYDLEWFVRSWDYKLLGFIPTDLHLFGVEKSLLPEYSDHLSDDGIYYPWGADKYGRDMFSRILFGSRISLTIGLIGIAITFTIGLFLGGVAGFYGGWTDEILMRLTEILMSIPGFYLIISLAAVLPTGISPALRYLFIIVILSFIGWPGMTRVIRGMTLGLKQSEFVEAAIALGYPPSKVISRHLLPNTATYVIVSATLQVPQYILGEAGLSFLGIGITEPSASWGLMLSQAQNIEALTNYPWLLLPGLFIFLTVISYNLFGDAIRDALDPRSLGN
jgi:peptide/nickel transport system permease protein